MVAGERHLAEELVDRGLRPGVDVVGEGRAHHAAPRAWVVRTALNLGVSWWRRRREVPWPITMPPFRPTRQRRGPVLIAALRRLPARQREVLALRIFLDLDTETTAKVLGIAPGTVMAHLHRAVAALRRDVSPAITDTNVRGAIR